MADFCHECSMNLWGYYYGDLARLGKEKLDFNEGYSVICEGCGFTMVDGEGYCLGDCIVDKNPKTKDLHRNLYIKKWEEMHGKNIPVQSTT